MQKANYILTKDISLKHLKKRKGDQVIVIIYNNRIVFPEADDYTVLNGVKMKRFLEINYQIKDIDRDCDGNLIKKL